MVEIFHVLNFYPSRLQTRIFNSELFPNYGSYIHSIWFSHRVNIKIIFLNFYIDSSDPTITQTFKTLFEEANNHFFPVQTVTGLVKDTEAAVTAASISIAEVQNGYLQVLQSIEKIEIGQYQFKHYNPKTKKTETIDYHFFTDLGVQELLQLGKDMN